MSPTQKFISGFRLDQKSAASKNTTVMSSFVLRDDDPSSEVHVFGLDISNEGLQELIVRSSFLR